MAERRCMPRSQARERQLQAVTRGRIAALERIGEMPPAASAV